MTTSGNEIFTELPSVTSAQLNDIICAVRSYVSPTNLGTSVQMTLQQVAALIVQNTILNNPGSPQGVLGGFVYQLCWDTTGAQLYICVVSGNPATAVWQLVANPPTSLVPPVDGGTGVSDPTAGSLPIAQGSSPYTFVSLSDGQMLMGVTGGNPVPALLSAGPGISLSFGPGTATISGTASSIGTVEVTSTSMTMVADTRYYANNAGLVTLTLPATAALGTVLIVTGKGAGGWEIVKNVSSQSMIVGSSTVISGSSGSVSSTLPSDSITFSCSAADSVWTSEGMSGNLTIIV